MRIWRTNLWLLFFLLYGVLGANGWWPFGSNEAEEQPKIDTESEKLELEGSGKYHWI
jgi:hypothetical protein